MHSNKTLVIHNVNLAELIIRKNDVMKNRKVYPKFILTKLLPDEFYRKRQNF